MHNRASASPNHPTPHSNVTGCILGSPKTGCPFYFATRSPVGINIAQQRPNATEGYGSAVYVSTRSNSFSIYYQFGGFSCGGQHIGDIFLHTDYDAQLLLQHAVCAGQRLHPTWRGGR